MRTMLLVLRKDLRLLRLPIAAWLSLLVVQVVFTVSGLDLPRADGGFEAWNTIATVLTACHLALLVVVVVGAAQTDPPSSPTAFWLTRPLGRFQVLGAKLLFGVIVVVLPWLVASLVALAGRGFSAADLVRGGLWSVVTQSVLVLPLLAIGALTRLLSSWRDGPLRRRGPRDRRGRSPASGRAAPAPPPLPASAELQVVDGARAGTAYVSQPSRQSVRWGVAGAVGSTGVPADVRARARQLDTVVRWADGRQEAARIVLPALALDSPPPPAGERLSVDGLGAVASLSLAPSAWVAAVSPEVWQEEHASAGVGSAIAHARLQLVRQRLVARLPLRASERWSSGSERILLLRVTVDDAPRVLVHETGPLGRTPTREEGRPWMDDGACLRFYAIHNPVSHELIGVRRLGGWAPRSIPPVAGGLQIEDFDLELVWPNNERWRERSARRAWVQGAELVKIEETVVAEGERTVELPELRLPAPPPSLQ